MAPQGVDQRTITHGLVFIDMAAEVHEFINQLHAGSSTYHQHTDIGRDQLRQQQAARQRHEDKNHHGVGREKGYPPIAILAKAHFTIGEKAVISQGATFVNRPQIGPRLRPMHDPLMQELFKEITHQPDRGNRLPNPPNNFIDVARVEVDRHQSNGVDDQDMNKAIVPTSDPRALGLAGLNLFLHHDWSKSLRINTLAPGATRLSVPVISTHIGGLTGREIDMQMIAVAVVKIDLPRLGGRQNSAIESDFLGLQMGQKVGQARSGEGVMLQLLVGGAGNAKIVDGHDMHRRGANTIAKPRAVECKGRPRLRRQPQDTAVPFDHSPEVLGQQVDMIQYQRHRHLPSR